VEAIGADMRLRTAVDELYAAIRATGRPVDALAINAGVGQGGPFVEQSLEDVLSIISLNVASTVRLARLVVADMAARGRGRVPAPASRSPPCCRARPTPSSSRGRAWSATRSSAAPRRTTRPASPSAASPP